MFVHHSTLNDFFSAGKTVISIALILQGLKESRAKAQCPRQSSATLVVVPSHLIGQWKSELNKFATGLKVFCIYDLQTLLNLSVKDLVGCDCVICPVDILESSGYLQHLVKISSSSADDCPKMPHYTGQKELLGATGVWIPATSADPYGGANNANNQKRRNASARYTHIYLNAVHKLRTKDFSEGKKGVPLEYFEWERIIVDEIHVSIYFRA
jgi:SNF2 family DNA or RNA helicase